MKNTLNKEMHFQLLRTSPSRLQLALINKQTDFKEKMYNILQELYFLVFSVFFSYLPLIFLLLLSRTGIKESTIFVSVVISTLK